MREVKGLKLQKTIVGVQAVQCQGHEGSRVQVLFQGGKTKNMTLHTVRSDLASGASHQLLKCHIDHKKNQLEYEFFRGENNTPND